ncbi:MAG: hypothetical protein V4631_07890 [Pseudomonadota bacterium]
MYGFPSDLNLDDIIGMQIEQICLGRFDVQFRFGAERTICSQALVEVFRDDALISAWGPESIWSNSSFQMLLEPVIEAYAVVHERLLEIRLKGGLELHLHDSSMQFESVKIYPEMIIV